MAISTNTFTINAGYAKSDLLIQLESSFTWLGWHDKCDHTGIVTGIVEKGMYLTRESKTRGAARSHES